MVEGKVLEILNHLMAYKLEVGLLTNLVSKALLSAPFLVANNP